MISIFFDLETSTIAPIGQILNYSFIATDDNFNIIDECSDDIRLSPLELPEPHAILANRIDVMMHQRKNISDEKSEMLSMKRIFDFFEKMIRQNRGEKIILIGYNSLQFDVPYLRTSMIRNGISPYFSGKIIYRDLLHLVRKLSCSNNKFLRTSQNDCKTDRLSLTLETTCQNYNVLCGKQLHSSRDDVILTINLAKKLLEVFNADIRKFNSYELSYGEHLEYKKERKIFTPIFPEYDLTTNKIYEHKFYALLDYSDKYSLWVDLDKFQSLQPEQKGNLNELKKTISWFNYNASYLFKPNRDIQIPAQYKDLVKESLEVLKDINLNNYFETSECDIEQDIYRLSFNSLDLLHKIIWENDQSIQKTSRDKELNIILSRWKLANTKWDELNKEDEINAKKFKILSMYADYRYGKNNKLLLNKFAKQNSTNKEDFHKSYEELILEIQKLKMECKNKEDFALLRSLEQYYKNSIIKSVL